MAMDNQEISLETLIDNFHIQGLDQVKTMSTEGPVTVLKHTIRRHIESQHQSVHGLSMIMNS